MFTFFKRLPLFWDVYGTLNFQCHSDSWKLMNYVVRKKLLHVHQPMYSYNLPIKDVYQTDNFLQKFLLSLISYLAVYSLLPKTDQAQGNWASTTHKPCGCLQGGIFGLALRHALHLGEVPPVTPLSLRILLPLPPIQLHELHHWGSFPPLMWLTVSDVFVMEDYIWTLFLILLLEELP